MFIVNDRVQTIYTLAEEIEALVPQARIAVAHGQMDDHDLERVMDAFLSRKFDVLVSTSIIESGLDVPNANTIIIVNAHHFGISQLYGKAIPAVNRCPKGLYFSLVYSPNSSTPWISPTSYQLYEIWMA